MPKRKPLTPYQRIVRAYNRGTGVHLSADDVAKMATLDHAIFALAENDDEAMGGNDDE